MSYIIVLLLSLLLPPQLFSHFRRKKEVNTYPRIPRSHLVLSRPLWPGTRCRDGTYHLTPWLRATTAGAGRKGFRGKIIIEVRRETRSSREERRRIEPGYTLHRGRYGDDNALLRSPRESLVGTRPSIFIVLLAHSSVFSDHSLSSIRDRRLVSTRNLNG